MPYLLLSSASSRRAALEASRTPAEALESSVAKRLTSAAETDSCEQEGAAGAEDGEAWLKAGRRFEWHFRRVASSSSVAAESVSGWQSTEPSTQRESMAQARSSSRGSSQATSRRETSWRSSSAPQWALCLEQP